ncbi:hypothetical protein SPI_01656 [Niveomyces insectorum RCEF 264]|uniref:Peroxin 11c n=1 Tax=Niveomyces insectorum RCEF 264 TaxID=1081102 RepID=A0A162MUB3_9HYPO|nr:hypothetical protein SPI_01656 [Niveomyces insectorum RCEF 264]
MAASSVPSAGPLAPANIDAFLLHLNKCMSTPGGIDAVLAAVCYSARISAVVLSTAAGRALLHAPVRQLVALALALPARASNLVLLTEISSPAAAAAATASSSGRAAAAAAALVLAQRLRALGSLMTEARMILRLWGLLSMQETAAAAKTGNEAEAKTEADSATTTTTTTTTPSTAETVLTWTQWATCTLYQAYENGAYLARRGVLGWSPETQARANRWSCRFFAVYVAIELGRLTAQTVQAAQAAQAAPAGTDADADTDTNQQATARERRKNLVRYAALAPVMAHWSLEQGFLGETGLTLLGSIPAALQIHRAWNEA